MSIPHNLYTVRVNLQGTEHKKLSDTLTPCVDNEVMQRYDIKQEIGRRIRAAREAKGWTLKELAAKTKGLSPSRISNWEQGTRTPGSEEALDLAQAFQDVSAAYILCLNDNAQKPHEIRETPPGYANVQPVRGNVRPVPVLNYIQAGEPRIAIDDYACGDGMDEIWLDEELAKLVGPYTFALEIQGRSMLPDFREGDRVVIDPDVMPQPGSFVVAKMDREQSTTFKKYRPRGVDAAGNEIFELVPLNEDFPVILVDSQSPGYVIGTMVEHRRRWR